MILYQSFYMHKQNNAYALNLVNHGKEIRIMDEEIKNTEPKEEQVNVPEEVEVGNIKISVDVVSTIAGIAASQTKGVACMYSSFAGGIAEMLGAKKNPAKGVKVDMTEDSVKIDLYIVVEYGVRIPELAWEIQETVKNNVETMTGLEVEKVNIHIEGVSFAAEDEPEDAPEEETEEQQVLPDEDVPQITD